MKKDLLSIENLEPSEIESILELGRRLKRNKNKFSKVLSKKTLALVFQKPSNRTRVSFEVGMYQLGGNSLYLSPQEINLGVRESIADVGRTISRYVDGIVLRTFEHKNCLEMAEAASVPVINGLSDFSHPCQALADILTIKEKLGDLKKVTLAYVGDGNNVCNSLLFAASKTGMNISIATPKGYSPSSKSVEDASVFAELSGSRIKIGNDPFSAVKDAQVVYTDVWASMGQEEESGQRKAAFRDFQINGALMAKAGKGALVMHCLPAHRGEEITDEVIDSPSSVVFDQAENRMHVQKAVLIKLLKSA
ncbi:MAG: ornithine carbamoyltransferase [Candidatus Omnitrophica bacterium]|nr:ornithine carbamoyltransferase [Candidatus Omnitrophota bacterium]MDD5042689.1 ornithine carbamoyltransferase [Candidatus Omnitrophota bacterium]MDD5501381.1 ornithine carbamoyltransferase [Candidatus Omnitrophota bacterium]